MSKLARVSDVLSAIDPDFAVVSSRFPDRINSAAEAGTKLHEGLSAIVNMTPCSFDGEDEAYGEAFAEWWDDRLAKGWRPLFVEERLESDFLGWHGQPDLVALDRAGIPHVIDFKRTAKIGWRYHLQLAAYAALVEERTEGMCDSRIILQFRDGKMMEHGLPTVKCPTDILHFKYALAIYRYKTNF